MTEKMAARTLCYDRLLDLGTELNAVCQQLLSDSVIRSNCWQPILHNTLLYCVFGTVTVVREYCSAWHAVYRIIIVVVWCDSWKSAIQWSVSHSHLWMTLQCLHNLPILLRVQPSSFMWRALNRFCTGQGLCAANLHKWGPASSDKCRWELV